MPFMGCRQGGKRRQKGEEIISSKFLIPQPSSGYRAYHVHTVPRNGVGYNQEKRRKTYLMKIKKEDVEGMILRYIPVHRKRGKKPTEMQRGRDREQTKIKVYYVVVVVSTLRVCCKVRFHQMVVANKEKGF